MKTIGKELLIGSGALALFGSVWYFFNLKNLKANLDVVIKTMIYKVALSGITIRIEVTMKNPTAGTIKVKYPFVKLLYSGSSVATSTVVNKDFTLPKFGELRLDPIDITLSFLTLATTVPALLKSYRTTGGMNLTVQTVTTLNGSIPYTVNTPVKI